MPFGQMLELCFKLPNTNKRFIFQQLEYQYPSVRVPQIFSQMPKYLLILTTAKRHKISQQANSTSYSVRLMVGTSGPVAISPCFPLTSVFLSTYLTSLLDANTNQHFMCPVQWNDLPEATWQDMNSPGPPPATPWYVGAVRGSLWQGYLSEPHFPLHMPLFQLPPKLQW